MLRCICCAIIPYRCNCSDVRSVACLRLTSCHCILSRRAVCLTLQPTGQSSIVTNDVEISDITMSDVSVNNPMTAVTRGAR
jgi:hypothetical protein